MGGACSMIREMNVQSLQSEALKEEATWEY